MNSDINSRLREQINEMERQENEWESEKSNFQSKILSLKEEESQWLQSKGTLLARLRILREAVASPPSKREEIISKLSNQPSIMPIIQRARLEEPNNEMRSPVQGLKISVNQIYNANNNSPQNLSPSKSRKISGKEPKKRKSVGPKNASPKSDSQKNSDFSGNFEYNIKWSLSQHLDCVRCVAFHSTLPYIATGSDDGSIRITNLEPPKKPKSRNPQQLMSLRGHSGAILSLASYRNNLISGDVNGQVCVWDFSETKSIMNESHGRVDHHLQYVIEDHKDAVWSIATHENSPYFITVSSDKTIRINGYQPNESMSITIDDGPTVASFNIDGSMFIVGCTNGHIHIFENKKEIGVFDLQSLIISICPSPNKYHMFIACEDKNIKIFDIQKKEVIKQVVAHELYTSSIALTSDGGFLVTTSPDKTIRIWKLPNLDVVSADSHHREKYGEAGLCVAATPPTNSHEYFASGGADGVVKVFAKNK